MAGWMGDECYDVGWMVDRWLIEEWVEGWMMDGDEGCVGG